MPDRSTRVQVVGGRTYVAFYSIIKEFELRYIGSIQDEKADVTAYFASVSEMFRSYCYFALYCTQRVDIVKRRCRFTAYKLLPLFQYSSSLY